MGTPTQPDLPSRVAFRYRLAGYFKPGDLILYGKYKNKKGKILRMFTDEKGHPAVEIEPVPKGRKKNKVIGLFKIWHAKAAAGASVDSGSLVIIDPAYVQYWGTGEHPELTTEYANKAPGDPIAQLHFRNGAPAAVVIRNFGGDGTIDVDVDEDEDVVVSIGTRRHHLPWTE